MRALIKPLRGAPLGVRILVIVALLAYVLYKQFGTIPQAPSTRQGDAALVEAFEEQRSGIVFEGEGTVDRTLPDDNQGSRHQKFILRLASGHTLLVSHNIDLAERLPLERGDRIRFRGQYEWNDRGGVIHWTHHDPQGRRPGGWLELNGRRYR